MKPKRNDPCSCGSGLKFKKCCGLHDTPTPEQLTAVTETMTAAVESHQNGQLKEAADHYRHILQTFPRHGDAIHLLGVVEYQMGNYVSAIDLIKRAIPLLPGFVETYINLGAVYKASGKLADAISCFQKALSIQPSHPVAYLNLGAAFNEQMEVSKGLDCYRKALSISPEYATALSSILFMLQYDPQQTDANLAEAHNEWDRRYGQPSQRYSCYDNDRNPDRRLRVGYVSPDFGRHPVGFFILPVLRAHDRKQVEVFCYSSRHNEDEVTCQLKGFADNWRNIPHLDSQSLAKLVREDGIDILVDLAGHSENNSLPMFALHPAPIQVTWLGYPGSTGLSSIDYRLTDGIADPPSDGNMYASESLVRLANGFLCYSPPEEAPEISPLPALKHGKITFGSFNNLFKINDRVIDLWAAILLQVPDSRLIIKSHLLANAEAGRRILKHFRTSGVKSEQIELRAFTASQEEHFRAYGEIDIALDTFPYNGTTTSFEALWMGVPVVALVGSRHAARVGASILSRIGLKDLLAATDEDYINTAVRLATNLPQLEQLRSTLRQKVADSPLCNAKAFTASIDEVFREMWHIWIKKQNDQQ